MCIENHCVFKKISARPAETPFDPAIIQIGASPRKISNQKSPFSIGHAEKIASDNLAKVTSDLQFS